MPDLLDQIHENAQQSPDTPSSVGNAARAAGAAALQPELNLGSRIAASSGVSQPTNQVSGDLLDQIHDRYSSGDQLQSQLGRNRQFVQQALPHDPNALSGKIGAAAGEAGSMLAAGPLAPVQMVARGFEGRKEGIEQAQAQGRQVSPLQQAGYLGGGAALDYATGGLLTSAKPAAAAVPGLLNAAGRTAQAAARGSAEMAIYNPVENFLASKLGVDPNRALLQDEGQAALTGGLISGATHGVGEVAQGNIFQQAAAKQEATQQPVPEVNPQVAEVQQKLNAFKHGPAGPAETQAPAEDELADESRHRFSAPQEEGKPVSFAEQLRIKAAQDKLAAFTPTPRRAEGPGTPEAEQRFEDVTKDHTFQTPEEATSNVFQRAAAKVKGPTPSDSVRAVASSYAEKAGLGESKAPEYAKVDEAKAKQIASDYDAMKHDPSDPKVKASYDAMKAETLAQYQHLKDAGYKFTGSEEAPHKSSAEVLKDLQDNKHLQVFTGGDMPTDHPLAEAAPANEDGLKTYNDMFRAVHDVFGHAKEGYGFGSRGEENAWRQHVQMYSPEARGAMTAETRGQNSWVNFGPQGEANRANPAETKYAEQKAGLLPEEHTKTEEPSLFQKIASKVKSLGGEESGADIGIKEFAKKDVIPTLKASAEAVSDSVRGLRRMFGGQTGDEADFTKETMKRMGSERAQRSDIVADQLQKMEKMVDKLPINEQRTITDSAETGQKQPDPKNQAAADAVRDLYDDRLAQIEKRDPDFKGIEDYMGHAWKDPRKASAMIADFLKRRPLAGDTGFKKSRVFMTQEEGIKAGLEPATDNPVTMARLKLHAMDQWITAYDARQTLDDAHLLQDVPKTGRLPEGMTQLNDPMFRGKMMNEEAASVLNNFLSPGIMGHPDFGGVMRGLRTAGNAMNQASLGISGIHAMTSSVNSALSEFATGLQHMAPLVGFEGTAHPVEGLKAMGKAATLFGPAIRDYLAGTRLQKEWLHPGSTDPETALMVDAMKTQGGRAFITHDYMTNATSKMMKAFREGNTWGGILRIPGAGLEQFAKPIMEKMVPKLKAGAFVQMARQALADHPTATAEELSQHMGDAWKSVDNRFGEMVHDNRFWNATARQTAQMGMRSVGWNYGTADELMGGAVDALKAGKNMATGEGAEFTHRMAYAVALPTLIGTWGAMMNYALTGKGPSSLKDMYAVPTGEKDKDGKDIRMSLPSYMRDVMAASHDLKGTIANKMHPLISSTLELLRNKDYFGSKVYQEDDRGLKIAQDIAKHTGQAFLPLSVQQVLHGEGKSDLMKGAAFAGVSQAPKWLSTSDAEQEAYKPIEQAQGALGGRTTGQQVKHDLTSLVRNKDPQASEKVREALKAGTITPKDVEQIKANAQKPGGLRGALGSSEVDARYVMKNVFPKMTPQEIQDNQFVIRRKLASANMPAAEKQGYFKSLNDAVGEKP